MSTINNIIYILMCSIIVEMITTMIAMFVYGTDARDLKNELLWNKESRIRNSSIYIGIKRAIDIIVGVCGLFFLFPLIIVIMILLKADGSKQILCKYRCVGKDHKEVEYLKFYKPTDIGGDGRVEILLHKLGIGGIPMLLSVIKGDMSIVGLAKRKEITEANVYNYEKPGIISASSVLRIDGCTSIDIDEMYIRRRSVLFDARVFLFTLFYKSTEIPMIEDKKEKR